jgi:integration host factor subunit beta
MIRSELVELLVKQNPHLRVQEADKIVATILDAIIGQLSDGGRVELRGFGAFSTRDREARQGRNPRTGDSVTVSAKRVLHFKPGKELRQRLNP